MSKVAPTQMIKTWDNIVEDTQILVTKLNEKNLNIKSIVAISRGGLVPATIVAQLMHLHLIDTVCIKTYNDSKSAEGAGVLKPLYYPDGGENVLVLDDLTDSGLTIMYIRKMLPKAHIAVLYAKPEGENLSDTFVKTVPQNAWLIFPWELNSLNPDFKPGEKLQTHEQDILEEKENIENEILERGLNETQSNKEIPLAQDTQQKEKSEIEKSEQEKSEIDNSHEEDFEPVENTINIQNNETLETTSLDPETQELEKIST